jgi:membrane associated rhomboid family serine protease
MADVIVPLVFFGFLGAVILVPIWLRERTRQSGHKVLQDALERGQTLDPALVNQLTGGTPAKAPPPDRARRTLGNGVVLLALAAGFVAATFMSGGGWTDSMMMAAAILGALGAAFLLLALVDYASKQKEQ